MELTGRTFVVGDVHGRYQMVHGLLREIGFEEARDHLWLVGDLVNRGPDSLGVLRWARELERRLGDRFVAVLGNHDTHLLALDEGWMRPRSKDADLMPILDAPDRRDLVDWLRLRPLLHRRGEYLLVHAGLHPSWTLAVAEEWARRLATELRSRDRRKMLLARRPPRDRDGQGLWRAFEVFTRVRTLDDAGVPCAFKGPPERAPAGCRPWFEGPWSSGREVKVLFGHWAALGVHRTPGVRCLDSGAAWNGPVSALCLEDDRLFQLDPIQSEADPTD